MTRRLHPTPHHYARNLALGSAVVLAALTGPCAAFQSQQAAQAGDPTQETASQHEADIDRLVKRLYLASAEDKRIETLTSLLKDPSTPVVRSALDLALREQTGGSRLDDRVVSGVLDLMSHPDPSVRSKAAALADLVASPEASRAIIARVAEETDRGVAEVLLRAAARWPQDLELDAVMRWNRADAPMTPGLARALGELQRTGRLDDARADEVLPSIALARDTDLTPSMCRLLAHLGASREHARLSAMMSAQDGALRRRAAAALAELPGQGGMVISAAMRDEALVEAAVVATHRMPPRDALSTLMMLPETRPDPAAARIRLVASRLPISTLTQIAQGGWSASRRIELLSSVRTRKVDTPERGRALVMLAEALSERGDSAQAAEAAAMAAPMLAEGTDWRERATRLASALDNPAASGDP